MKQKIIIEETLRREVEIDTQTEDDALAIVRLAYKRGEIVLDYNDLSEANIYMAQNPLSESDLKTLTKRKKIKRGV